MALIKNNTMSISRITLLFLAGISCFSLIAAVSYVTGPPPSMTGAPTSKSKETTCVNCHLAKLNAGKGTGKLTLNDSSSAYTPGKSYELNLTCVDENITRFGFQITALNESNEPVGTFPEPTNPNQQLITGEVDGSTRSYVEHTMKGTSTTTPGKQLWKIMWQAPEKGTGKVTFYVSWVAANANNQISGDNVYNFKTSFEEQLTNLEAKSFPDNWSLAPNPTNGTITLNLPLKGTEEVNLELLDLHAKTQYSQRWQEVSGIFNPTIRIPNIPLGYYTVKITVGQESFFKRIIVQ